MWKSSFLCMAFGLAVVSANFQMPNLENVGSILQTLKNTGMMDQFQEKFSQMFVNQKGATKQRDASHATNQKDEVLHEEDEIDNDPQYDVYEFAKSYNKEKKLELSDKIIFYLSDLPIGDSYHVHTAKLSGILDQIGQIFRLKNKNLDGKVVDLVRRVKSLAIMKTSLERLYQDSLPGGQRERKIDSITDRKPTAAQTEEKTERQTKTKGAKNKNNDINVAEEIKKGLLPENIKFHLDSIREDPEQVK